jgi:hypothetical protein
MKRISPAAIVALKDALTHIYWRKQDLRGFLEVGLGGPELVSRLDWTAAKREAVGALITHLQRHESQYQEMRDLDGRGRGDGGLRPSRT